MFAYCRVLNYTPVQIYGSANNLAWHKNINSYFAFHSARIKLAHSFNMAAWFYTQFSDVTAPRV